MHEPSENFAEASDGARQTCRTSLGQPRSATIASEGFERGPERTESTMEVVVGFLIVAALVGGVALNHKSSNAAMAGVEFSLSAPPGAVAAAVNAAYCGGAKAKAKAFIGGVTVRPLANSAFLFDTKIGDTGRIEVRPGHGSGSTVRACATELYVGSHPKGHFRSGLMGFSARIVHGIYKLLGISPNASKVKRFQRGLEGKVSRQLNRA